MAITLADYQEDDKRVLLANRKWGLFHEMGVGKTFPAIAAAHEVQLKEGGQILCTVPAYLIPNWETEIRRFCGEHTQIAVANGEPHQRRAALNSNAPWVLTSYHNWANFEAPTKVEKTLMEGGATVTRRMRYPELMKRKWAVFIYDEAHRLRGRNSMWTKEMMRLHNQDSKNKDSRFWYLTGTPVVRDPGDIFTFLKQQDKGRFSSYWNFVEYWCHIDVTPWDKVVGQLRQGLEEEFTALLNEYSSRKLLADIPELAQLEVIGPKMITVNLPASVYTTMKKATKDWVIQHPDLDSDEAMTSSGQLIHKLRLMSSLPPTQANPVLEATLDFVTDHEEPLIVWCWYRDTAYAYSEAIQKANKKRKVFVITGDVPNMSREAIIAEWRTEAGKGNAPILLATVAALKEGVNLQESACQLFVEVSDLPSDNDQAISRSKRRGQTRPVRVYAIVPANTAAAKVYWNQSQRRKGIRRAMLEELIQEAK